MTTIIPPTRVFDDDGDEIGEVIDATGSRWVKLKDWNQENPFKPLFSVETVFHIPDGVKLEIPIFYNR